MSFVCIPVRMPKHRFDEERIGKLLEKKWWDSEEEIKRVKRSQCLVEN